MTLKNKLIYGCFALIILSLAGGWTYEYFNRLAAENQLGKNQTIVNRPPVKIQTKGGGQTSYVAATELPQDYLKKDSMIKDLEKKNVHLTGVVALWEAGILVKDSVTTRAKDTVIRHVFHRDTTWITGKSVYFADKWLTITGYVVGDSAHLKIVERMDVHGVLGRANTKAFGRNAFLLTLSTSNPHVDFSTMRAQTVFGPRAKWYQTRGFAFAGGALVGFLATLAVEAGVNKVTH